jgi:hypothetical protein
LRDDPQSFSSSQDYVADMFQPVKLVQRSGVSTKQRNLRDATMDEFRSITMREWQEQAEAQSKHESVMGSGEGEFRQLLAKFGFHLVSSACPKTTA